MANIERVYNGNLGNYTFILRSSSYGHIEIRVTPVYHSSTEGGIMSYVIRKDNDVVAIIELHTTDDLKPVAFPEDIIKATRTRSREIQSLIKAPETTTMTQFIQRKIKNKGVNKAILYYGLGLAIGYAKVDGKVTAMKEFPNRASYHAG